MACPSTSIPRSQIALPAGTPVHLFNAYIPPVSSAQPNPTYRGALDVLVQRLGRLPAAEPWVIVGDFNSKLGDLGASDNPPSVCPCHGLPQVPLCGSTCTRGGELFDFACVLDLHVLNGCSHSGEQATYREERGEGAAAYMSTLDYALVNTPALQMLHEFQVVFQPRRESSRKYHAHLVLTLCGSRAAAAPRTCGEHGPRPPLYRWR